MKALTAIDFLSFMIDNKIENPKIFDEYLKLVSQDFNSQMIKDFFTSNHNTFASYESRGYILVCTSHKPLNPHIVLYPKTLNDFIGNCKKSGIPLEWKGDVWNE